MMTQVIADGSWLPLVFAFLMGLSMLVYSVLDGYDLGIGMLSDGASAREKDLMIASIGPFWDANETWLILGVGLLLVAFPAAHGIVLTSLYLPVAVMLFGLIFRGVAFDFRAKVPYQHKWKWNNRFFFGSLLTSLAQGYMLGSYILGFEGGWVKAMFSCLTAVSVASAYCLIGACWLIMKGQGDLQKKAVSWARYHLVNSVIGLAAVFVATPLINPRIFEKWFSFPEVWLLSIIPGAIIALVAVLHIVLRSMPMPKDHYCWLPFVLTVGIYVFSFIGLAYSFFPYIIPEKMVIVDAAAAPESLKIMLFGTLLVLPVLIAYTALAYYVFRGKATELQYY